MYNLSSTLSSWLNIKSFFVTIQQVSTGGTESILLACKAFRDYAKDVKGIQKPEMVVPVTAHSAFDKAAQYLNIRIRSVPVDPVHYQADVNAMKKAINSNTILVNNLIINIFKINRIINHIIFSACGIDSEFPVWDNGRHWGHFRTRTEIQHSSSRWRLSRWIFNLFHGKSWL